MQKRGNTPVGSRPSATGHRDVAFVSRAPSRHHDASTRLLSIWPVPEGVRSLDAEHPESVWYATQDARSPLPVKEAGHGSASPPTDWGLFSGPSSLTADESWVIGEGGYETGALAWKDLELEGVEEGVGRPSSSGFLLARGVGGTVRRRLATLRSGPTGRGDPALRPRHRRRSEAEGSLALSRKGVRGNQERRRSLSQLRPGATARSLLRRGVLPAWPHLSLGTEPRAGDPRAQQRNSLRPEGLQVLSAPRERAPSIVHAGHADQPCSLPGRAQ